MKKSTSVLFLMLVAACLFATPRGLTVAEVPVSDVVSTRAVEVNGFFPGTTFPGQTGTSREQWYTTDSHASQLMLRAGAQAGMQFNNSLLHGVAFSSMGVLSPEAVQAVAKAPDWIAPELSTLLMLLQPDRQVLWANLINSAVDPYVDEIAFCVATSSPEYLNSAYANPQLFLENAQLIYSIASDLPYVEVVDTGSAVSGGDYYSTTRYYSRNAAGETVQQSVPRDIYYWYVVHPKITDEIAAYIDPAVVENNSTHVNNITDPPTGKFWRSYLYNLTETGRPVLADSLAICQTLYNQDGSSNDAIHAMQTWINANMSFNSNNERPHQPVRIIAKRMGRCGEYSDLTSAVARLGLIPCTGIMSVSTDHTWNEFWDGSWHAWEPVNGYINNPLVYENGWGKVFGSVFEMRPDGLFTPVTDRYSEGHATINIQVVDSANRPVDGARVVLAIVDGSNRYDCELATDNGGMVSFCVGENRNYRARCEASFGLYPAQPGTYAQLIDNSVDGQVYNYIFTINNAMPQPIPEQLPTPDDQIVDYRLSATYSCSGYYITGTSLWDDICYVGSYPTYYKYMEQPAMITSMVADADNMLFWEIDHLGSMYSYVAPAANGTLQFNIPIGQDWFAFADNSLHHRNAVKLNGIFLLEHYGTSVQDDFQAPAAMNLGSCYPNPFTSNTKMQLELPAAGMVELSIYNLKGQKVRSLDPLPLDAGSNTLSWDGKDDAGHSLANGIYFLRVANGKAIRVQKAVLAR